DSSVFLHCFLALLSCCLSSLFFPYSTLFRSVFLSIDNLEPIVSYLIAASSVNAVFYFQPSAPVFNASSNILWLLDIRLIVSASRIPFIPTSSKALNTPLAPPSVSPNPFTNAAKALVGLSSHVLENCSADIPATFAKLSKVAPPSAVALVILLNI